MSTAANEVQDRVLHGIQLLRVNLLLDPDAKTLRVVMSPDLHAAVLTDMCAPPGSELRIGGVLCEPDPCLTLAQMRFRTEVVI